MKNSFFKILLIFLIFNFAFIKFLKCEFEKENMATLEFIKNLHLIKGKFEGKIEEGIISKSQCLYTEWIYGIKDAQGSWVESSTGYRSENPISLKTSVGTVEVSTSLIRPYLNPISRKVFSENNLKEPPQPVQEKIIDRKIPVSTEEYCLKHDQVYFVQVKQENLKRKSDFSNKLVLYISDIPFKKNKPQRSLTPLYQQIDY